MPDERKTAGLNRPVSDVPLREAGDARILPFPSETARSAAPGKASASAHDPFSVALIAHLPQLRRYARALSGSTAAADDLVQDCLERALRRAKTLQNPNLMASWLRAILHNIFIDDIRRKSARGSTVDIDDVGHDAALSAGGDRDAQHLDIVRAVNRLGFEHRQVLLLVAVEGLSYSEIAAELGVPIGTVMSRLARAREKLRMMLEPDWHPHQGERND